MAGKNAESSLSASRSSCWSNRRSPLLRRFHLAHRHARRSIPADRTAQLRPYFLPLALSEMCVSISSQVDRHVELFSEAEDCKRVSKPANADFGETTAVGSFQEHHTPCTGRTGYSPKRIHGRHQARRRLQGRSVEQPVRCV